MARNNSILEIVFKVQAKLRHGEDIRLSGNVPVLGCDDIDRAIPLYTTSEDYPWWSTEDALFLPSDPQVVQYRYCVFSGGKFQRWEGNGKIFRTLSASTSNRIMMSTCDIFDSPQSVTELDLPSSLHQHTNVKSFKSRQFAEWSRKNMNKVTSSLQSGVVIISYILPVILTKLANGRWSAVWDDENILALTLNMRVSWVGTVKYSGGAVPPEEEESVSRVLLAMNCHPVFISQVMNKQFYDIYCKQYLWPMMHHVADIYGPLNLAELGAQTQQDLWFNYSTVTRLFRDKVVEVYQNGDIIWIHGFHLMLLPSLLRRRLSQAKIAMFFHTSFPSSEIWRTNPRREDLLRGILSADHIGFHLYEYARHFRSTCHRLLGYNSEMSASGVLTVFVDGREVAITCMHVGVDLPRLQNALSSDTFENEFRMWRSKFSNKIIIAGLDRLERLKGIPLKLDAIYKFMEVNPKWQGKLGFLLIGVSAFERREDYKQTQFDVNDRVEKLNKAFGTGSEPLVIFEERSEKDIRLPQRLAFFASSDIFMTTATRDSLNRFPMEFTLAKQKISQTPELAKIYFNSTNQNFTHGLVIMSEFMSSARVMRGAVTVNPWKIDEVIASLRSGLEMSPNERSDRNRRNLEFSTRLTTTNWASQVLDDILSIEKVNTGQDKFAVGFGISYRVMGVKAGFQELDLAVVTKSYRAAKSRLLVLDWGGTLVAETSKTDKLQAYAVATGHAAHTGPTEDLKEALESLCSDPRNTVFVVSGKEVDAVSNYFGNVHGLGLGAEHGFYYRWPLEESPDSGSGKPSKWQTIQSVGQQTWKEAVKLIMEVYVQHTLGTYIEHKGSAMIWQFRDADPEFGYLQSKELEDHLKMALSNSDVDVIRGGGVADGYIEVRPAGVSKGLFLQHAMATLKSMNKEVDFILALGDDISDEPMFEHIASIKTETTLGNVSTFPVAVGKKPTSADSYVDDPKAVLELLGTLIKSTQRDNRYFSSVDLENMGSGAVLSPTYKSAKSSSTYSSDKISDLGPTKALSENNLKKLTTNFEKSSISPTEQIIAEENLGLPRSTSNHHLTMNQYLNSIENESPEDDGLFF